jgi:DNA-binding GntR family transcriptional regulator
MRQLERPRSLTAMAVERLRDAIVAGDLALGEQLSEAELACRLGISKTPVREALQQLRAEGLVRVVPQTGTFVFTMSATEVRQLSELRLTLERAALGFAMERDRPGLVAALGEVVAGMREARRAGDVRRYLALDTAYHAAFFARCGNPMMRDAYDRLVGRVAALRTHLAQKPSHTERSMDEHVRMLGAARDGGATGLFALLGRHIERTRETYAADIGDIAEADQAERRRLGRTA